MVRRGSDWLAIGDRESGVHQNVGEIKQTKNEIESV
jgi:hypothetical protein